MDKKQRLSLIVNYDDKTLAAELNNMEKQGTPVHRISNGELEAMLRYGPRYNAIFKKEYKSLASLAGSIFPMIDAIHYAHSLKKAGAKNIEIVAVTTMIYLPRYSIEFDGDFDVNKFVKMIYS